MEIAFGIIVLIILCKGGWKLIEFLLEEWATVLFFIAVAFFIWG